MVPLVVRARTSPDAASTRAGARTLPTRIGLIGAVAVTLGAGAWLALGRGVRVSAAEEGSVADTLRVERRPIGASVLATGVIRPQVGARVAVGSRVSGVLARLHVTVGDEVRAGELLAELDPTEFEAGLDLARAALETAQVERDFAQRQLERADGLVSTQVIAQAEYDDTERLFMAAAARVREAEASVRAAEIRLGYTRIGAPISGVVATVTTQVGETVAASFAAPTFVTIIDLERLEVWAYVDETDIGRVEIGQTASFTVDTYPGEDFEGVVTAIRPQAEIQNNVVNYVTVIEIADPGDRILRPEMTTTVNIRLGPGGDAVAVPNAAIERDDAGTWVVVPGPAGPVRRQVRLGRRGRTHSEVLSGLAEGEEVLVTRNGEAR